MITRNRLAIPSVVIALMAGSASADSGSWHGGFEGPGMGSGHGMMEMMMRMHGMMGRGGAMPGMGMMYGGMPMMDGMVGMPGMGLGMALGDALDEDGDGTVTAQEVHSGMGRLHTEYDADGNGALSLDEFEALHSALIREMMVDRFQHLDADGDGQVTEAEMHAHAEEMERMHDVRERMMHGFEAEPGRAMPGEGRMMDESGHGMQGRQEN